MRVALVFNLIRYDKVTQANLDTIAEYDSEETIDALTSALESGGHEVTRLEADRNFPENISKLKGQIDIVFNIAEGLRGECRESQVPVLLEMLGIPYTGSGPLALAVCLDKVHTKEVLVANGLPTGAWKAFDTPDAPVDAAPPYPCVVKLRNQGSSMGLSPASKVRNETELKKQLNKLYDKYRYPMFAEEYLPGREFTIPVIGNSPPRALPVVEIVYPETDGVRMRFFEPDEWVAEKLEIEPVKQNVTTVCPAEVDENLREKLNELAVKTYKALGCRDWCRMEFRMDREGKPRILELNPIAGIDPSYWLPRSARSAGMSYDNLINTILDSAIARHGKFSQRRV